ncbi:hypothetical protein G9A89_018299 [Geosiphon pyriformis]|nr:hypothetical protein G9A89_018299 [Geosiphon pyriformis]
MSSAPGVYQPYSPLNKNSLESESQNLRHVSLPAPPQNNNNDHSQRSSYQNLKEEIQKLQQENERLKQENERLTMQIITQQHFGNALNTGWSDDDIYNSVNLRADIAKLGDSLNYITSLKFKNEIVINKPNALQLMTKYKCRSAESMKHAHEDVDIFNTNLPTGIDLKQVLKAALQRHLVESILDLIKVYLEAALKRTENITDEHALEAHIIKLTNDLIIRMTDLSIFRIGNDDLTKKLPVKLRQQIAASLGARAFIQNDNKNPFLEKSTAKVINLLNECRTINNVQKNQDIATKARAVVVEVIRVFYFALYTQDPVPDMIFYEAGDPVNFELMEGAFDPNEIENLEVEVCYFPVIGTDLNNSERKLFRKAQVLTVQKASRQNLATVSSRKKSNV